MGSLQAVEGEVRSGEVVLTRSSGGFLADAFFFFFFFFLIADSIISRGNPLFRP